MKPKELKVYTVVFILLSMLGGLLTFSTFSNIGLDNLFTNSFENQIILTDEISQCSQKEALQNLNESNDRNLIALDKYQQICSSFVSNRLMIFIEMPTDELSANTIAENLTIKLKEFSKYGVTPVVIAEPVNNGNLINYNKIKAGEYDKYFESFFSSLKLSNISDEQMGIWVPFPESNTPIWNHGESLPEDFAVNVNKYLGILKKHFPSAKSSVLLNSVTYDPEDSEWENGDYISLAPYTSGLNPDLVDSFGIQGFPWVSRATQKNRQIFDANEFLAMRLAIESARLLRTRDIWVNTGTFGSRYTDSELDLVTIGPDQRKAILDGIYSELAGAQDNGYRVWINIFAENKSKTTEATDWSYTKTEGEKIILREFIQRLDQTDIELSFFDI